VRLRQLLLALFGGGEPERNALRALFHRPEDHRPHELRREPDEQDEHDHLHDERERDVHCLLLACAAREPWGLQPAGSMPAGTKGFAKVKNSAKPMPMNATASTSAATMNMRPSSSGASSGWRATPSRKRPPRMPKPMAVPRPPMPNTMPTASAVMAWICATFSIQP